MILSHLDFCNSLLYGLPDVLQNKLKRVLYAAVCFIFNIKKRDKHHLSPYLKHFHFLPVTYCIQFKIALLTYKCINGLAPKYMKDLLVLKNLLMTIPSKLFRQYFVNATRKFKIFKIKTNITIFCSKSMEQSANRHQKIRNFKPI